MKNTARNIICIAALCALCVSFVPRAVGADAKSDAEAKKEAQLKLDQYIKLAKMVYTAGSPEDAKAAIKTIVKDTVDKAGDAPEARSQALSEIVAALTAALTAFDDAVYAADLHKTLIEAAAEVGGSDAEKLSAAKLAASTTSSVTESAGYTSKADEAVSDKIKSEVKLATSDPKSVLSEKLAWSLKDLYEKVLAALRGSKYQIKLDIDEMTLDPLGRGTTTTTLGGSGDYVGKTHYPTTTTKPSRPKPPVPPTTKPSPTPVGLK